MTISVSEKIRIYISAVAVAGMFMFAGWDYHRESMTLALIDLIMGTYGLAVIVSQATNRL